MLSDDLWHDVLPLLPKDIVPYHAELKGKTIAEMAKNITNSAPEKFALCGFSMGGYVARELARQAPLRLITMINIASSSQPDSQEQARQKIALVTHLQNHEFAGIGRQAILKGLSAARRGDAILVERIKAMGISLGKEACIEQSQAIRHEEKLEDIDTPTLIIAGEHDELRPPSESEHMVRRLPNAYYACISDTGHMIPLEQPERLAQVLNRWFDRTT